MRDRPLTRYGEVRHGEEEEGQEGQEEEVMICH
jgi:hypothetical protein